MDVTCNLKHAYVVHLRKHTNMVSSTLSNMTDHESKDCGLIRKVALYMGHNCSISLTQADVVYHYYFRYILSTGAIRVHDERRKCPMFSVSQTLQQKLCLCVQYKKHHQMHESNFTLSAHVLTKIA